MPERYATVGGEREPVSEGRRRAVWDDLEMTAADEPRYDVVWPRSPRGIQSRPLAARLSTLNGATVAFLWDHLFRGDELFPLLADHLQNRYDVTIVDHTEFGNLHGADEKERIGRLPDDLRTRGVDAVVSGMGC